MIKKRESQQKFALSEIQALNEQERLLNIVSFKDAKKSTTTDQKPVFNIKGAAYGGLNFSAKDF